MIQLRFKINFHIFINYLIAILFCSLFLVAGLYVLIAQPDGIVIGVLFTVIGGLLVSWDLSSLIFKIIGVNKYNVSISNERISGNYGIYNYNKKFSFTIDEIQNIQLGNYLGSHTLEIHLKKNDNNKWVKFQSRVLSNNDMQSTKVFRIECVENYKEVMTVVDEIFSNKDAYLKDVDTLPNVDEIQKPSNNENIISKGISHTKSGIAYIDEITKLKELYDMGALTKEEFEQEKKEVLNNNHKEEQ